jgi:enoyl-CoA hydratase/carnithine racemase
MEFDTLRIEGDGPIRHVILNRPHIHNAINEQFIRELTEACIALDSVRDVRVVILRGAGKSFSSGADLNALAPNASGWIDNARAGERMYDLLTNLAPITIACMHGYCIGGGAVLPAACDFRLAATSTSLTINEISIGFNLTWHTIPAIVQLVGAPRAKEMILLGHTYSAAQLLDYGFVNEVVDDDALLQRALELADEICKQPPWPTFSTKASINAYSKALDRSVHHLDCLSTALMSHGENSRIARETYFNRGERKWVNE